MYNKRKDEYLSVLGIPDTADEIVEFIHNEVRKIEVTMTIGIDMEQLLPISREEATTKKEVDDGLTHNAFYLEVDESRELVGIISSVQISSFIQEEIICLRVRSVISLVTKS